MTRSRELIESLGEGSFRINLDETTCEVLATVCRELRAKLGENSEQPVFWRLFPEAYPDDSDQESFYRQMTHESLVDSRIEALRTFEDTLVHDSLSIEQIEQWMTAINSIRLTLGALLDITDSTADNHQIDPDDPMIDSWVIYEVLGYLLASIVLVVSES